MTPEEIQRLAADQAGEQQTAATCRTARHVGAVVSAYYAELSAHGFADPLLEQLALDFAEAYWATLGVRVPCHE